MQLLPLLTLGVMVLKTAETKQIFVVFAEVIIHHVQIVKETSNLGLSTMDHVVSCCALLQLVLYYGIFQLEKIRKELHARCERKERRKYRVRKQS